MQFLMSSLCIFFFVFCTGGDWEECYELVMKEAREQLSWTPGTNKILVMIGDARPHPPRDYGVYFKEEKLDWKEEATKLLNSVSPNKRVQIIYETSTSKLFSEKIRPDISCESSRHKHNNFKNVISYNLKLLLSHLMS